MRVMKSEEAERCLARETNKLSDYEGYLKKKIWWPWFEHTFSSFEGICFQGNKCGGSELHRQWKCLHPESGENENRFQDGQQAWQNSRPTCVLAEGLRSTHGLTCVCICTFTMWEVWGKRREGVMIVFHQAWIEVFFSTKAQFCLLTLEKKTQNMHFKYQILAYLTVSFLL